MNGGSSVTFYPPTSTTSVPAAALVPLVVNPSSSHLVLLEYESGAGPDTGAQGSTYQPLLRSADMTSGYDSADPAVITQHLTWMAELGIDAVISDQSNGAPCAYGGTALCTQFIHQQRIDAGYADTSVTPAEAQSYVTLFTAINAKTFNLYPAFTANATPIKIVPLLDGQEASAFLPGADGITTPFDAQITAYLAKMQSYPALTVNYLGKPLMLAYVAARTVDILPSLQAAMVKWQGQVTIRVMAGYVDSQPYTYDTSASLMGLHQSAAGYQLWDWIDRFNPAYSLLPAYSVAGQRVESFSVTTAASGTTAGWTSPDATLYQAGATITAAIENAKALHPIFLIVNQFNEFQPGDEGDDEEHSNDIEPTTQWGRDKFNLVKSLLASYRSAVTDIQRPITGLSDYFDGSTIQGWACQRGSDASIQVDLYLGAPLGIGLRTGRFSASLTSELAVAGACGASGSAYRFSVPISNAMQSSSSDSMIYLYGTASNESFAYIAQAKLHDLPIYRFYETSTGVHFFTNDPNEKPGGFAYEGINFRILATTQAGTHAIYRCFGPDGHFVSADLNCGGNTTESAYGYVYDSNISGTIPLYSMFLPSGTDQLVTTNSSEGGASYTNQSILGYVHGG